MSTLEIIFWWFMCGGVSAGVALILLSSVINERSVLSILFWCFIFGPLGLSIEVGMVIGWLSIQMYLIMSLLTKALIDGIKSFKRDTLIDPDN